MTRKLLIPIILLLLLIFVIIGYNIQPKDVPQLQLQYIEGGEKHKATALLGTRSWRRWNSAYSADSLHPLDSVGFMPVITKTEELKVITLSFASAPDEYSARYWTEDNIGKIEEYETKDTAVEINNNTITLPESELGLIYEIHAIWSQGDAYYSFYITNKE